MDLIVILFFAILAICVLLIVMTLVSLLKLGDERKNLIKMKAQSHAFTVIVGWMLIEIFANIYKTIWTDAPYEGMNPFVNLIVISIIYLLSLLFYKKKYGD